MEKAGKIRDLLSVEEEVARVHGDIETISGRMRYLGNRVALSTIEVELEGPRTKVRPPERKWEAPAVLRAAYRSLRGTGQTIATVLIWTGVYLPVWLPLGLGLVWVVRWEARS